MGEISINPLFNVHEKYKTMKIINPYRYVSTETTTYIIASGYDDFKTYISYDLGDNFTEITSSMPVAFSATYRPFSAAMSRDGDLMMLQGNNVSSTGDYFFLSTDYGDNWTRPNQNTGAKWLRGVQCTDDGKYSVAHWAGGTDYVYSNNYGSSYTRYTDISSDNSGMCVGLSGSTQIGMYAAKVTTGYYETSWPSGTPTSRTIPSACQTIYGADDGSVYYFGRYSSTSIQIFKTVNQGSSFTTTTLGTATSASDTSLSCSSSGQYVIASHIYPPSGTWGVWTSDDYGVSYTFRDLSSLATAGPIGNSSGGQYVSKSGKYMITGNRSSNGKLLLSTDYGVTWAAKQIPGSTSRYFAVTISG